MLLRLSLCRPTRFENPAFAADPNGRELRRARRNKGRKAPTLGKPGQGWGTRYLVDPCLLRFDSGHAGAGLHSGRWHAWDLRVPARGAGCGGIGQVQSRVVHEFPFVVVVLVIGQLERLFLARACDADDGSAAEGGGPHAAGLS